MVFNYGGGNNAFNRNGDGFLTDAFAYAVRFDYSVAANLNVWGVFSRPTASARVTAGDTFNLILKETRPMRDCPGLELWPYPQYRTTIWDGK